MRIALALLIIILIAGYSVRGPIGALVGFLLWTLFEGTDYVESRMKKD